MNVRPEPVLQDLLARQTEIAAVGFVDKDMGAIRPEAADELGLVLDNIPVPLLAFLECFVSLEPRNGSPDLGCDRLECNTYLLRNFVPGMGGDIQAGNHSFPP
jgi:hypothetical protein